MCPRRPSCTRRPRPSSVRDPARLHRPAPPVCAADLSGCGDPCESVDDDDLSLAEFDALKAPPPTKLHDAGQALRTRSWQAPRSPHAIRTTTSTYTRVSSKGPGARSWPRSRSRQPRRQADYRTTPAWHDEAPAGKAKPPRPRAHRDPRAHLRYFSSAAWLPRVVGFADVLAHSSLMKA